MKNRPNILSTILITYLFIVIGFYLYLFYPVIIKPKNLSQTKIPSLSLTKLNEAGTLLKLSGKTWINEPYEPNTNDYIFGQKDPI